MTPPGQVVAGQPKTLPYASPEAYKPLQMSLELLMIV